MTETREVPGFPDYQITRDGEILGKRFGRPLRTCLNRYGYPYTQLMLDGKRLKRCIHRLMCRAWIGPKPSPLHEVAHWDGDPTNNRLENLRWATRRENEDDRIRHGNTAKGVKNPNSVYVPADIVRMRFLYEAGFTQQAVADVFGTHQGSIGRIVRRERWGHVL